jgi:DNA-directed RNA polymerase subunit M/transcription elongation factor TFIIS
MNIKELLEPSKNTCRTILYKKQFKDPEIYEEIVKELNVKGKESIVVEIKIREK